MLILKPPIQMGHSVKEIPNDPLVGVFDLKNPRCALLFAQFF
jgi:hypothetical protein